MSAPNLSICEFENLKHFVRQAICQQNELEATQYPMTEKLLLKKGRPCGVFFCLHGPRSVKLIAIWERDRNVVFFYGSTGERLCQAPWLGVAHVA